MTVVQPNSIAGINSISVQSGQSLSIHKSDGTLIREIVASTGISTFSSISVGSAATANNAGKSINIGLGASISQHSDNTLSFGTNGIVRARIDSSGNFGIGTNSYGTFDPDFPLEIGRYVPTTAITDHNSLKAASMLCLHSSNNVNDSKSALMFSGALHPTDGCSAGIVANHENVAENSETTSLSFYTSHSETLGERLRITSAGLIGIGTAAPAQTIHLSAASGDVYNRVDTNVNGGMLIYVQGTQRSVFANDSAFSGTITDTGIGAKGNLIFRSGTSSYDERLRIRPDGRISIGSSVAVAGVCTAAAFIPSKGQLSNRNIAINGAMQVAQRATSNTDANQGYKTVDRFTVSWSGLDSVLEQHQVVLTSGTPYNLGFRYAWQLKNGDQTGGAGTSDYIQAEYRIEARDLAQSGWDYVSSSSYITLSFWMKTSVSQDYTINLTTRDGTSRRYPMKTGTIAADTWTKITKTIPGDSNITINNDNGDGMAIMFYPYLGNNYVGGSSINAWSNAATSNFGGSPDTAWYTTNDATFEVTGFQVEVGQHATPFEHRSYGEDLARCQRYYCEIEANATSYLPTTDNDGRSRLNRTFPTTMRAAPSGSMANYTLSTKSDGVTGYQSSSSIDVLYKGTFDAEI